MITAVSLFILFPVVVFVARYVCPRLLERALGLYQITGTEKFFANFTTHTERRGMITGAYQYKVGNKWVDGRYADYLKDNTDWRASAN